MASSERRFIRRSPVDFIVDFIHAGDYMISCSNDISMDGMFINTNSPAPSLSGTGKKAVTRKKGWASSFFLLCRRQSKMTF
jgi:hypothetical protein